MNSSNSNTCVFRHETGCRPSDKYSRVILTAARKSSAEAASEKRKDGLKIFLSDCREDDLHYHNNCYLSYVSPHHIQRLANKRKLESIPCDANKRKTRSSISEFNFLANCFICGTECNVERDKKHPDRWEKNKAYLCKTAERGKGNLTFKESLLNICTERGDELANEVQIRFAGATSDLHAAEARYHV